MEMVAMAPPHSSYAIASHPSPLLRPPFRPPYTFSPSRLPQVSLRRASPPSSFSGGGGGGTLGGGFSSFAGDLGTGAVPPDETLSKQPAECPPGLKHYEAMAVLRPDINEDQRLAFSQRYEEAIIAGGGMGIEVFNRGMMPLAYPIKRKDMAGITNKYLDGIYYLLTYFTKPEGQTELEKKIRSDDYVLRFSSFLVKRVRA